MNGNNFKLGYLHIDKYRNFYNSSLIKITSLNQLRKNLTLNIVSRNNTKYCYISTQKKQHILKEKAVAKLIEKPIVLISTLNDNIIEDEEKDYPYHYYSVREKYCDYILVLHYPYFNDTEEEDTKKSTLYITKSKKQLKEYEFDLCYSSDYCLFT